MTVDALTSHFAARASVDWASLGPRIEARRGTFVGRLAPSGDAHLRFIDRHDRPRDSRRAERFEHALAAARRLDPERPLAPSDLIALQRLVLGSEAPLRRTDAFGKDGRERYGWLPDLRDRIALVLAEAADPAVPVIARAIRAWLDVLFLHPFEDGNARAARLVLDIVLTRGGERPVQLGPVLLPPVPAGTTHAALSLLDRLASVCRTTE